jgi:hypothetical protein
MTGMVMGSIGERGAGEILIGKTFLEEPGGD